MKILRERISKVFTALFMGSVFLFVGGLSGSMQIVAAAEPMSLQIVSPNGGELLYAGKPYTIKWSTQGSIDRVKILLLDVKTKKTYHVTYGQALDNTIQNKGSFQYTIPLDKFGNAFKMRIISADGSILDESDNTFSVTLKPGPADIEIFPFQLMVKKGHVDEWYTVNNGAKFEWPTGFSANIEMKDGKRAEYWRPVFNSKVVVRNIGGQKSNFFTMPMYFDNHICTRGLNETKDKEYPPLVPGESREVDLPYCMTAPIKRVNAEFHSVRLVVAASEYLLRSMGLWNHNDFMASFRFPDYWNSGLVLDPRNEIYLGRPGRMSPLTDKQKLHLLAYDQLFPFQQVGVNRYKVNFWMDFTVKNKFPVTKSFWLQSQKNAALKSEDRLWFSSGLQTIGPKETKKYHVPIVAEVSLNKEYKVEFRFLESDPLISNVNPDFVLDGKLIFIKR